MKTGLAIVVAGVIGLLGGYFIGQRTAGTPEDLHATLAQIQADLEEIKKAPPAAAAPARRRTGPDPAKVYEVKLGASPVRGAEDAKITIVEFSDFQCPYCSRVGPTLERLLKEYPEDVRVVYKHLPLSFHSNALPAAKASAAAAKQGKFWEMHDQLFLNQKQLTEAKFVELAGTLGLDVGKFEKDFKSDQVASEVSQDMSEARRLGVTGTPGFFVNGRFSSGAKPYESFKAMVDAELKKQG